MAAFVRKPKQGRWPGLWGRRSPQTPLRWGPERLSVESRAGTAGHASGTALCRAAATASSPAGPPLRPQSDIEIARRTGITKVNIDTDLRMALTAGIRKVFAESPKEFDPRKYLAPARTRVKELVRHKLKNVLCCAGHAFD